MPTFTSNGNSVNALKAMSKQEKLLAAALNPGLADKRSVDGIVEIYEKSDNFVRSEVETERGALKGSADLADVVQIWTEPERPVHPSMTPDSAWVEFENLYNGVNGILTYVPGGTSTWTFGVGVVVPEDVDLIGMKIRIQKNKFGPTSLPSPLGQRFINIDPFWLWMKCWYITKMEVSGGQVILNLDIPALSPPP